MSALLLRWLNEELKLHRKVEVLERDASNGYIIAEVLHILGLEPHLETYENSSSTVAKIRNMERLGDKLEALGVPFPVNTRRDIMKEDRSAVLQFLLQLRDFLRRRPTRRPESTKAKVVPLEQPAKAQPVVSKSFLPSRDVEEHFVVETTKKFHPKEVRFHKEIDMAVHLRKFEQAQWQTENEINDFQQQANADKNKNSSAGYAAARAHLQEKAQFMRDWDIEHHKKWKDTQRINIAGERNDLRLELALEARRQVYAETKLLESRQDAAVGVVEFERNLTRLALAAGGAEQTLRAIPACDAGALAHVRSLEKRVEDLDFRPSNNVKMMKELRKRRKAQMVAEKDRRMRRQKALADQKKSIEVCEGQSQSENHDNIHTSNYTDETSMPENPDKVESIANPCEKYLQDKRAELEENYARLHESGSAKREEERKVLQELRNVKRKKEQLRAWGECSDAIDGLISLTFAIGSSSDRDALDVEVLKRELFLQVSPPLPTLGNQGGEEMHYELDWFIQNFLSCSEVWATLPLQSRLTTYDVKTDIQTLTEIWANPTETLDTSWHRPPSFILLSVFSEDDDGIELARRVSMEHHLTFLQLDLLVEECVKKSYDPQKLGDQVASLSDRDREFGAFGPKITGLRQKNTPLPDALAVEIMAKAVFLCRQEASASSFKHTLNLPPNGCMLLNFPRTVDEAKLLEKAILADIPSGESGLNSVSSHEGSTSLPEEATVPAIVSAWGCVVSIAPDQPPVVEQADADKTLHGSDSSSALVDKQKHLSSKMLSAESQRKVALDEEQRARNEEQKANLETYWGQTTRHILVKRAGLHRDVLAEVFHLCIDAYTQNSYKTIPTVIECGVDHFPEQLKEERSRRRESMNFVDRIMWMKASIELELEDEAFQKLFDMLQKLEESLYKKIREPMATIRAIIQAISALAVTAEQDLETELFSGIDPFQVLLDQAATKLKEANDPLKRELRERILTELEVSLGDMADFNRVAGNDFVAAFGQDPFPAVMSAVEIVYQCVPSICFFLQDFTMQKLELLRTQLYGHLPFLTERLQDSGHKVMISKSLSQEAMDAATELGGDKAGGGQPAQLAGEKVWNILSQVASEYAFHLADEPPSHQYTLCETNVTTMEITRLLQQVTLLCRFADRLRQTTGQLYASDVRRLQQTVRDDIHMKDKSIAEVMADVRIHGHATWPIRDQELSSMSGIATRLPRAQKENFFTIAQLSALVQACVNWELSDSVKAGGATIASDVFVALVLEVAEKDHFPTRWRDARAVAAVTLQQVSTRGAISWRNFVWSLLCIEFTGMPSLEDILAYEQQALTQQTTKRHHKITADQEEPRNLLLSHSDFWHLPLWFEGHNHHQGRHKTEKLKELMFQLFTSNGDGTTAAGQLVLLPMLLCWCVHPSCSFNVRHELEEFAPRYPRGLFRAFHLLRRDSTTTSVSPQRISSLFAVSGSSLTSQNPPSVASFSSFCHDCPTDLHRFFLMQNPFEALVQSY